ncbi:M20/M25/M40 family metallo-hydrolase [Flavobacteriaceae bacterium XHP0103]|uniref:M20/M25/M40 family metallo-hydrolase n=1 Tax=Marixanthotalea marina TaxID=2844359 RepID=UPI002989F7D9|nr:M20/M25/M40 family metallo-hydrolase [Marixanthotalea marina]MBU3823065.1 M20/M25/M40 family metallo-hydrolase [Marixanthotalea marina]
MKKVLIASVILILIVFLGFKIFENDDVSEEELRVVTSYLASDELEGRDIASVGIEKAAVYLENVFKKNNIKPYFETYRDNFKWSALDLYNIVGYIEGTDPKLKNEVVIIGAHYDHLGTTAEHVGDDEIANGANDNASGTSTVLLLAQRLAKAKKNKRSIIVAFFSAEEKGMLGSKHLAKRLKEEGIDLYTMLNFEMTGVPFKDRDYMAFVTGYDLSNMSQKINEYANNDNLTGLSRLSKERNLFERSDNFYFYEEFKVPCQTISCSDVSNYDYYHHVDDEVDKLDFEHMVNFTNAMLPVIETICNTPTKEIKLNNG